MSVGKEIGKGTLYNAIAKYVGILINLVITGILARLLSPDDFGVVALTTVVITFFDLLGNMGFGPAIIQNKELNNRDLASIFNLTIIIALAFSTLCFITAPYVARLYGNIDLLSIMRILSLQVMFTIMNVVPYSLLLKAKKFKIIALTNVIGQFSFGTIAVIFALSGLGIYSLLIAPIGTILSALVVYTFFSKKIYGSFHIFVLDNRSIRKVLSFSVFQFLFNVVNYFSRNLDKLLIGNRFSMSDLGYYEKSYRLMQLPISNISSVMAPTIQPVLSAYQDDKEKLCHYTNSVIRILAYIGCTITPLLFFCSREIILIVFGSNWEAAVPIFQVLSLSVFAQVVDSSTGSLLQAANAPKLLFSSGLVCAILNVACIFVGVFIIKTTIGLAWMLNIAFTLNLVIDIYIVYVLALKSSLVNGLKLFTIPLVVAFIMSATLLAVSSFLHTHYIIHCTICFVIGFVVSIICGYKMGVIEIDIIKLIKK